MKTHFTLLAVLLPVAQPFVVPGGRAVGAKARHPAQRAAFVARPPLVAVGCMQGGGIAAAAAAGARQPCGVVRTTVPLMDASASNSSSSSSSGSGVRPTMSRLAELRRNLPLGQIVLILLVLQNSLTAILARQSRVPSASGTPLYLGSVAVLVAEIIKLPICLGLIVRDEGGPRRMLAAVKDQVFVNWRDTLRMGVPALCYCLQNALFFVALSHLSATSYQLWSQSKTLFTAFFFVTLLGRTLSKAQWLALSLLTAGVGLVQYQEVAGSMAAAAASTTAAAGSGLLGGVGIGVVIGVGAVLFSSLLSGFANVYFEKVVKKDATSVSIWMRNVQLGLFSLPQAASLMAADAAVIAQHGALVGFTPLAWAVVLLKALGGLLVAAVVKYADNVLKTYATAIAIVLTCVLTCLQTRIAPSLGFLQGMAMVIASIFLYNFGGAKKEQGK